MKWRGGIKDALEMKENKQYYYHYNKKEEAVFSFFTLDFVFIF